jgi:hypothetical protein
VRPGHGRHPHNAGYGHSLKDGIRDARYDLIAIEPVSADVDDYLKAGGTQKNFIDYGDFIGSNSNVTLAG